MRGRTSWFNKPSRCARPGLSLLIRGGRGEDPRDLPAGSELLVGPDALEKTVSRPEVDVVLAAIVGSAGLRSTWAALEAGKTVALANKETLVMAGPLVMALAARRGACILPVDSEHSAVFQALQAGRRDEVKRIILTASGGPFRKYSLEQLRGVTVTKRSPTRRGTWVRKSRSTRPR